MRTAGGFRILVAATLLFVSGPVAAQGVSDASVVGTVITGADMPAVGALVTLLEVRTGVTRRVTVGADGAYSFENMPVGSYRLEARAIGMMPATIERLNLHIGDRVELRMVLSAGTTREIETLTVTGHTFRNAGAGGPATTLTRETIRNLPLMNRDFVGLFSTSAQATGPGSLWVSGQHNRFNSIQVDGTIGNDVFGTGITPGSALGARSVSLEALDEVRILVAPFDIRQGGFSGGLINAVTRSGTNTSSGSLFTSYSSAGLVGADTAGFGVPTFDQLQVGLSIGGPVIRNRLHYFAVVEAQSRSTRFEGFSAEDLSTGVSIETASRAARAFRERFNFDPGGPEAPILRQPNANLFVKLSWHPSTTHSLFLTQSYLRARNDNFNRESRSRNNVDGWQLSNSGHQGRATSLSISLKAISVFNSVTNEAIAAVSATENRLESAHSVPLFLVQADLPGHYLAAGSVKSAQDTRTRRSTIELTDNLSLRRGSHLVTVGTQNVLFRVEDNFSLGAWGVWTFASVDALERGSPSRYEVNLPMTARGPLADYKAALLSGYVQDHWRLSERLSLTAGLRVDVPLFENPVTNDGLAANAILGNIDTGDFPSGNRIVSARTGFAWTPRFAPRSVVRGGIGSFAGRPPLVWLTGAYSGTGEEQTTLTCSAVNGVPPVTIDVSRLPTECLASSQRGLPNVNYFDSDFRFQHATKYALGVDHRFSDALTGSLDVVHSRSSDNLFMGDVNLVAQGTNSEGRAMYGGITTGGEGSGVSRPARADAGYGSVFRYENVGGERSTSIAVSAQHAWRSGAGLQAAYGWSQTSDVMSLSGLISSVIFRFNPVDGTLARRNLRRSARDVPHTLTATLILPTWAGTTSSLFLRSRSGTPYAFSVQGDANADGESQNDLAYIPASLEDFSLADPKTYEALDAFIESQPCLRGQRGAMMTRNSCRNPAVSTVDARISRRFQVRSARGIEVSADVFNAMNLVNRKWGLTRETTSREVIPLYWLGGWDAANNRPRYFVPVPKDAPPQLPPINGVTSEISRWRIQLGARLDW